MIGHTAQQTNKQYTEEAPNTDVQTRIYVLTGSIFRQTLSECAIKLKESEIVFLLFCVRPASW